MNLTPRRPIFNRRAESRCIPACFFRAILVLTGIWLIIQMRQGDIKSPFAPAPTPTRTSNSYAMEEGMLNLLPAASIMRSRRIARPFAWILIMQNAWAELARIQAYSSTLLTTDAEIKTRLNDFPHFCAEGCPRSPRTTARPMPCWPFRSTGMPAFLKTTARSRISSARPIWKLCGHYYWTAAIRSPWPIMPWSWSTSKSGRRRSNISRKPLTAILP